MMKLLLVEAVCADEQFSQAVPVKLEIHPKDTAFVILFQLPWRLYMKLSVKRFLVPAGLLLATLFCLRTQKMLAQNQAKPSQPTFRTTTRLVVVDVVATDEKGSPVKDLKAEDFVVSENKEPQKVIDFSFHQP